MNKDKSHTFFRGPISHILSFLVLSQLPPSFNRSFPPPGFSLEPYGGGHTFYSGEQKYLPTSATFVNFGIRRGIGKYCWRLVLKYFLSGETFALLKIWIHHRWKYLILTNLKSCNVSLKYQFVKEKWRMNVNLCRCTDTPNTVNREKPRIISRGSSFRWEALFWILLISSQFIQDKRWRKLLMFRYSGRTQKQMQEHVRENFVKRQSFQRWFLSFLPPIFLNQKSC